MHGFANVRELLEARVKSYGAKTFLISEVDGREWSYQEFNAAVNRMANLLLARGIRRGDVVSFLLPNSAEYIIAYFACWKIGALAGPVNSLLKKEEIDWVVGNSEAKLMLVGSEFAVGSEPSAVAGGLSQVPGEPVEYAGPDPHREPIEHARSNLQPPASAGGSDFPRIVFDDISVANVYEDTLDQVDLDSDDEAIIIY